MGAVTVSGCEYEWIANCSFSDPLGTEKNISVHRHSAWIINKWGETKGHRAATAPKYHPENMRYISKTSNAVFQKNYIGYLYADATIFICQFFTIKFLRFS